MLIVHPLEHASGVRESIEGKTNGEPLVAQASWREVQ